MNVQPQVIERQLIAQSGAFGASNGTEQRPSWLADPVFDRGVLLSEYTATTDASRAPAVSLTLSSSSSTYDVLAEVAVAGRVGMPLLVDLASVGQPIDDSDSHEPNRAATLQAIERLYAASARGSAVEGIPPMIVISEGDLADAARLGNVEKYVRVGASQRAIGELLAHPQPVLEFLGTEVSGMIFGAGSVVRDGCGGVFGTLLVDRLRQLIRGLLPDDVQAVRAIPNSPTVLVDLPFALTNQSAHRLQKVRLKMVADRERAVVFGPHGFVTIQNPLPDAGNKLGHGIFIVASDARCNRKDNRCKGRRSRLKVLEATVGDNLADHRRDLGFHARPLRLGLRLPRDVVLFETLLATPPMKWREVLRPLNTAWTADNEGSKRTMQLRAQPSKECRVSPTWLEVVPAFDTLRRGENHPL